MHMHQGKGIISRKVAELATQNPSYIAPFAVSSEFVLQQFSNQLNIQHIVCQILVCTSAKINVANEIQVPGSLGFQPYFTANPLQMNSVSPS